MAAGTRPGSPLVRAVVASAVGTAIEWYDFFLYGVAAALVFPKVFFPGSNPYVGTLLSFTTYFVGFVARPLGAALFGHVGDRVGRKASLVATLVLMGLSTVCIGLVPSHESSGIWGAVLLTVFRVLQGVGVGGEWAGSVLLASEWGTEKQRGFLASWPQFGAPAGLLLANGAFALSDVATGDAFLTWGWRIPFVMSLLLVLLGLWMRGGVGETPVFERAQRTHQLARTPLRDVVLGHWREILWTALLRTGQQTPFYIFTAFILSYGTQKLGWPRSHILGAVLGAAAVSMVTIPLFGALADRVGRRRLVGVGAAVMLCWPFAYFALLDARDPLLLWVAVLLAQPIHDLQYAPQAAVIAECFPPTLRYSGASMGYQLASLTSGGPAPLMALWLLETTGGSVAVAMYVSVCAAVSLLALRMLAPFKAHAD